MQLIKGKTVWKIYKKMRQTKLAKYPVQWMDICVVSFTLLQRLLSSKSRVNIMMDGLITNMNTIKALIMDVWTYKFWLGFFV